MSKAQCPPGSPCIVTNWNTDKASDTPNSPPVTEQPKEDLSCRGTTLNGCSLPFYCQKNIDENRTITPCHFQSFPCQRRADRQRAHERGRERQGKGAGSARGYVSGTEGASNTIICYQNIVFFKYLIDQLLLVLVGIKLPFPFLCGSPRLNATLPK